MACAKRVDDSGRYVGDAEGVVEEGKEEELGIDRKDGVYASDLVWGAIASSLGVSRVSANGFAYKDSPETHHTSAWR